VTTPIRTGIAISRTYTQVVLPVDFSPLSWRALPLANAMARGLGVPRRIVHVDVNSPWLDEGTHRLALKAAPRGEPVDVDVIAARTVSSGIIRALGDDQSSLLVMSTHGHTGMGELVMGSTAEEVLRTWLGPLLAVGPHFRRTTEPIRRLVLAVEPMTPPPLELVQDVRAFALRMQVPVSGIAVTTPAMDADTGARDSVVDRLQSLAALISVKNDVNVQIARVNSSREAHAIQKYADAQPGTMLALPTHARGPGVRLVLGGTAMHVLRHSESPVLLRRYSDTDKE